jgi:aspartate kinase
MEENISEIFALFHQFKLKVNSKLGISFSVFVEDKFNNFTELNAILSKKFKVDFSENVTLYTIDILPTLQHKVEEGKNVILKQISTENHANCDSEKLLVFWDNHCKSV